MRVLVTDAEIRKSLAVVRGLGPRHEVITASSSSPAVAAWSRYSSRHLRYRFDETFPDWLLEVVGEHGLDAVVCPQEATMAMAARVYDELESKGAMPTFPRPEILEMAFDKTKTLRAAASIDVPIPRTVLLDDVADAAEASEDLGFPLIVKHRYSHFWNGREFISSDGTQYAAERADLERIMAGHHPDLPPPLLQEFVPGDGLAVFLLLDRRGEVCGEFAHRRIRDIRPTGSGSVMRESVPVDPGLRRMAVALLRELGWWGVAMVEFRTDARSGGVVLMEVNGRFWGSLQLALDAGVNFPDLLTDVVEGLSPAPPEFRSGIKVRWWLGDLARTIRVLKGPPRGYVGDFPTRWSAFRDLLGRQPAGTINEIYRREDPWPAAGEVLSTMRSVI